MEPVKEIKSNRAWREECEAAKFLYNAEKLKVERFADLLRQIAYPRFGTEEDEMDREDCAKLIQSNFTADELDG